ncbi:MAG: AmmeMemoRadiSam system protein B [Spirochaetaceae bacterium]|jgi:AmmeMemoRadiSam system protein B|nr:AmmeMemoRadiSam system protein B [Spirochaetaceae bacterium]
MNIRKMRLPSGWYPHNAEDVKTFLKDYSLKAESTTQAVVSPHAGWFFSGRLAALAISSLRTDVDTVVVAGGHLPPNADILFAQEDGVETPLGIMNIDSALRTLLQQELGAHEDTEPDNTVEVLLPAVHYFFPNAKLLCLRLPPNMSSCEAGKIISRKAAQAGRTLAVIASTDLTHYGKSYGFSPQGEGEAALRWVKEVNDRRFLHALETGNPDEILKSAEQEHSACSAGAVLCALGFSEYETQKHAAFEQKEDKTDSGAAKLLGYTTSYDVLLEAGERDFPREFVSYAALEFCSASNEARP